MSVILAARDVVKSYGARRVLDGVSLSASPGQRIGLIGENGAGKSTLLRLLAGVIEADGGEVTRPSGRSAVEIDVDVDIDIDIDGGGCGGDRSGRRSVSGPGRSSGAGRAVSGADDVGFLHQELPYPGQVVVGEVVDDALADIRAVQRRLDELGSYLERHPGDDAALAGYGEALQWAADHELWDADRRADLVLAGLGLAGAGRDRPVGTLSGGERSRLGLAALLIRQPRALLLDEPTNHLDDEALEFVESHVAGLPGAVVLASHDRVFLDAVCTAIVDLDPARGGVTRYGGSYSDYLSAKRVERARWEQQYEAEQAELKQLRRAVTTTARQVAHHRAPRDRDMMAYDYHGGRVQSQISRRVRNAQRRLDELDRDQVRKPPAPLRFRAFTAGTGGQGGAAPAGAGNQGRAEAGHGRRGGRGAGPGDVPGSGDGVVVSLRQVRVPGRLDIDQLDVPGAARLLVTGPNGAGKSTLLAVLAGRLVPRSGTVAHRSGLRIGLLAQEVTFPDPARAAREIYAAAAPRSGVPLTDLGLIAPRDLDRPVGVLSVGQRRRLGLALLVADSPQLTLLDEPTNHISLSLAEELAEALASAPAAVVAASHDRWLRRSWAGPTLWLGQDHRLAPA